MPRTELQEWPLGAIQWILARNRWCSKTSVPMFRLSARGGLLLDGSHLPDLSCSQEPGGHKVAVGDTHTPETSAPFLGKVIRPKSARRRVGSQQKYKKPDLASGLFFFERLASLTIRP
jgi:hypothetical protein